MDVKVLLEDINESAAADQQQERLKLPLIIAMKGLPFTGKDSIARTLASTLHYPLITRRDLQHLIPPPISGNNNNNDRLFEAICQIASTQLIFNDRVILDSNIHSRAHLDRLLELAASKGSRLVIIECQPGDWYEWKQRVQHELLQDKLPSHHITSSWEEVEILMNKHNDFDTSDVPKLIVDTTKLFDLENLVEATLSLAFYRNPHTLSMDQWEEAVLKWKSSKSLLPSYLNRVHAHTFGLCNFQIDDKNPICSLCNSLVTGSAYNCQECDFVLHKSCAELLPEKSKNLNEICPAYLKTTTPDYSSIPEKHACNACVESKREFSDHCSMCLATTLMKSELLPSVYNHGSHEHPLKVYNHGSHEHPLKCKIRPLNLGYESEFECRACGNLGKGISYSCERCKFHLHVNCLLLPPTLKHPTHLDILYLNYAPPVNNSNEYYCDACETKRNPHHWVYYCEEHEFAAHLSCLTEEVRPYRTINSHTYHFNAFMKRRNNNTAK